nr:hypothetical protein [Candidatus Njordarchaeota archaeon]
MWVNALIISDNSKNTTFTHILVLKKIIQKSAFLTYQFQAFYQAHRSFLEVSSGYYNAGNILLWSVLESLIKGAFLECPAHKRFRDNARVLSKPNGKKTILDWMRDLITINPSIETELEETSGAIFDKTAVIFDDPSFKEYRPTLIDAIEQLSDWNIFEPVQDAMKLVHGEIYRELSKDVHVIPDKTDIGRRLSLEKDLFETTIIPDELTKFMKVLRQVIDIGVVVELNILSDWINGDEDVRAKLKGKLTILKGLGLPFGHRKLRNLLGQ